MAREKLQSVSYTHLDVYKRQVKARTGEELWSTKVMKNQGGRYIYDDKEKMIMIINMPSTLVGSIMKGFKNQLSKINHY